MVADTKPNWHHNHAYNTGQNKTKKKKTAEKVYLFTCRGFDAALVASTATATL